MKFVVDNQLPTALARYLRTHGFDCHHVLDIGLAQASDEDIALYAAREGRTIISKDEDFFHLANRTEAEITVVWIRLGNCRTSVLLHIFEKFLSEIDSRLQAGDRVIEIR